MPALIIDSSYLIFRSFFAYPNLTTKDGRPSGAFFGFTKTIFQLVKKYQPDTLVFAKDLPVKTWRHEVYNDYKAGRPEIDQNMVAQIPAIHQWSQEITPNCFAKPGFEADDYIYSTSLKLNSENQNLKDPIYIFSSDKDLYQLLVLPNINFIKIDRAGKHNLFSQQEFLNEYEINPTQWLDYKTLVGDNSDNLMGVPGIGPKTAIKLLKNFGSLYFLFQSQGLDPNPFKKGLQNFEKNKENKFLEFIKAEENKKIIDKICQNYSILSQTFRLATLSDVPETKITKAPPKLDKGNQILESYDFHSLVKTANKAEIREEDHQESLF